MNRRRFLQALFAVPVIVAPLLAPTVAPPPQRFRVIYVGLGYPRPDGASSLNEALRMLGRGGTGDTVVVMPGVYECTTLPWGGGGGG